MGMGMAARGVGRACEQPQREPPRPELDRGARARGAAWIVSIWSKATNHRSGYLPRRDNADHSALGPRDFIPKDFAERMHAEYG
eukprot:scaffold25055_cov68-Phaeocystis_antarctica.AAC.4